MISHPCRNWLSLFAALSVLTLSLATGRVAMGDNSVAPRPVPTEQSFNKLPPILEEVGIEDKAGAFLPRGVSFTGSDGRSFVLGEYMDGDKPLVLVLAYYRCPMLCSMVLRAMDKAIAGMTKEVGKDFRVLVISFDPRDTTSVAHDKRANYLSELFSSAKKPGLDDLDVGSYEFATGSEEDVRRVADAIGFHYKWDDAQKQYAHAAGLFVITPKGKLSQTFTGIEFNPDDVDRAVGEAYKEVWHSPIKSTLLYCFMYDPKTGHYVPVVMNVMKIGAALTILLVGLFVYRLFRAEKKGAPTLTNTSDDARAATPLVAVEGGSSKGLS